jgi:hypothetical protein
MIDRLTKTTHRDQHHGFRRPDRNELRVRRGTRDERARAAARRPDAAEDDAAGPRAVPRVVEKSVIQIVLRIRIVVVEVEALGDEQA